ncbi:MAG: hypothetical protein KJZ87_00555 [Thermoguttaceae bacterium]|nr:hypothetical protein [Thermoguttaceae bacterium]
MHFVLYVCVPQSDARTSLQARRAVAKYLTREAFDSDRRFAGRCDYFVVGGRWSGRLNLLRLRHEDPKRFDRFWKKYWMKVITTDHAEQLFRKVFPDYGGKQPFSRDDTGSLGEPDDAQIMDKALYQQLKPGFSENVDYSFDIEEPNVIFTDDPDPSDWPRTIEDAAKYWVVVIDYHD